MRKHVPNIRDCLLTQRESWPIIEHVFFTYYLFSNQWRFGRVQKKWVADFYTWRFSASPRGSAASVNKTQAVWQHDGRIWRGLRHLHRSVFSRATRMLYLVSKQIFFLLFGWQICRLCVATFFPSSTVNVPFIFPLLFGWRMLRRWHTVGDKVLFLFKICCLFPKCTHTVNFQLGS